MAARSPRGSLTLAPSRRGLGVVVVVAALTALVLPEAAHAAESKVGLAPFGTQELLATAERAGAYVSSQLPSTRFVGPGELTSAAEMLKGAGLRCDAEDMECLVKLGIFARLDRILVVTRSSSGATTVRSVGISAARELARSTSSGPPELVMRGLMREALLGTSAVGFLTLNTPPDVRVSVDGVALDDATAASALGPLLPGGHLVRIENAEGRVQEQVMVVVPGKSVTASLRWKDEAPVPSKTPPAEPSDDGVKPSPPGGLELGLLVPVAVSLLAAAAGIAVVAGIVAASGFGVYQFGSPTVPAGVRNASWWIGATGVAAIVVSGALASGGGAALVVGLLSE